MQPEAQAILWFAGRLLLGGLFVVAGVRHFFSLRRSPRQSPRAVSLRPDSCCFPVRRSRSWQAWH